MKLKLKIEIVYSSIDFTYAHLNSSIQVMKLRDELVDDPDTKFYAAHHNCRQTPDESMMLVKRCVIMI